MIIERADMNDAEEILNLQKLAYQSEAAIYEDDTIPPLTQTLDEIKADFHKQVFLKAFDQGRIIGSVRGYIREDTCFIGRLIVHPEFQNQGIGTQLMNEIENDFGKAKRFELFTGHKSEKNISLYQKLRYQTFRMQKVTENLNLLFMEKFPREEI